jgi:hypothetical protein
MLQQGHCIPSHFKKISHVVQRFCPNSYLEQLSLPGFDHLYFAHTPLQPIKKISKITQISINGNVK